MAYIFTKKQVLIGNRIALNCSGSPLKSTSNKMQSVLEYFSILISGRKILCQLSVVVN